MLRGNSKLNYKKIEKKMSDVAVTKCFSISYMLILSIKCSTVAPPVRWMSSKSSQQQIMSNSNWVWNLWKSVLWNTATAKILKNSE